MAHGITDGPLTRAIFRLAWPVILAEALHTAFHVIDIVWIGGLGPTATAAATTSTFAAWLHLALAHLVTTGVAAHVSQAIGAGDRAKAARAATQGLHLSFLLGVAVAVFGWLLAPALFRLIGGEGELHRLGVRYLRVVALGAPATFCYLLGAAIMRASGNTRLPLVITAVAVVINVGLAPLFVYTLDLGIEGAPMATVVCLTGATLVYVRLVIGRHHDLPFDLASLGRLDWRRIAAIAGVGAPYALVVIGFAAVYLSLSHQAAAMGVLAVAVVGITNRLESLCYIPSDGFAAAAATVVGQNLGAGKPQRAERGAWSAVAGMTLVSLPLSAAMLLAPEVLLGVFTNDPALVARGVDYVRIMGLCQLAVGVEGTLIGGFTGAGYTVPPFLVHVVFSSARIPLGWIFAEHWGLEGIAIMLSGTCVLRAAIIAFWFRRRTWQRAAMLG
jgi:putative MATE family efflux protein